MASKIKQNVLDELQEAYDDLPETSMKSKLLEGLINSVAKLDDDKDIVNTVWANKDLPLRMFTTEELELMPSFNSLLIGEPYKDKVDKDKYFGKDWYKNISEIPHNKIALVAAKEGRSTETLIKEMTDEAIQRNRYDVAHEGVLGTVMPFVAKRTQEAIERGEEPSGTDYALDFLQTGLEAVPYGRAAKFIANPAGKFIVGRILSNATAPVLTEAADAAAYDSTNTRGNFDWRDVAAGAGTNLMGEGFLRTGGAILNKTSGGKAGTLLMNLGEGESRKDAAKTVQQLMDEQGGMAEVAKMLWDVEKNTFKPEFGKLPNELKAKVLAYMDNADANAVREVILDKLHKANPVTKGQKLAYKDYQPEFLDEEIRFMMKDPQLSKYLSGDYNFYKLPSELRLGAEEGTKNLITNKLGSYQQEQGKAFTRIPFGIGTMLQKAYDESKEEEDRREEEERIYNMYKLNLLGGN